MNILETIEEKIGGKWVGITFHNNSIRNNNTPEKPMCLCEAIGKSYNNKIVLTKNFLDCPGGCRSLGWLKNSDYSMINKLAEKSGMSFDTASKLITSSPSVKKDIFAVTIGKIENPDMVLSYAQPDVAMKLIRLWQKVSGIELTIDVSSIMAVCSNVVAKVYNTGKICISFGCPDSREYGGIEANKLVIGVHNSLIEYLL